MVQHLIPPELDQSSDIRKPHWLLWDGQCGFCRKSVAWVKDRDKADIFLAVPYQQAPSPPMTAALADRCREAVQVLEPDGTVHGAGMACAFVLGRIGYPRLGRIMTWPIVRSLVEWGYRRVANNREFFARFLFRAQSDRNGGSSAYKD